ncbi:MAG TPA: sulfite exporter TauE/SafE family protein, partial [Candidatus Deferrimicrobiaceae bacterium]|nr:sulfite exporter TauE/SafE family protein [Candidatus Deferrimicrobiaceae bacterium]
PEGGFRDGIVRSGAARIPGGIALPVSYIGFLLVGGFTGAVSGMFGIGGGVFVIPAMVYIFGFSQKMATGTSLAMLLPPIGILAFLQFYRAGYVNVAAAVLLVAGFLAGSWLSPGYAVSLPEVLLKRLFGGLLMVMGAIYILTAR